MANIGSPLERFQGTLQSVAEEIEFDGRYFNVESSIFLPSVTEEELKSYFNTDSETKMECHIDSVNKESSLAEHQPPLLGHHLPSVSELLVLPSNIPELHQPHVPEVPHPSSTQFNQSPAAEIPPVSIPQFNQQPISQLFPVPISEFEKPPMLKIFVPSLPELEQIEVNMENKEQAIAENTKITRNFETLIYEETDIFPKGSLWGFFVVTYQINEAHPFTFHTKEDLKQQFSEFGEVKRVNDVGPAGNRIITVWFTNEKSAKNAIEKMRNVYHGLKLRSVLSLLKSSTDGTCSQSGAVNFNNKIKKKIDKICIDWKQFGDVEVRPESSSQIVNICFKNVVDMNAAMKHFIPEDDEYPDLDMAPIYVGLQLDHLNTKSESISKDAGETIAKLMQDSRDTEGDLDGKEIRNFCRQNQTDATKRKWCKKKEDRLKEGKEAKKFKKAQSHENTKARCQNSIPTVPPNTPSSFTDQIIGITSLSFSSDVKNMTPSITNQEDPVFVAPLMSSTPLYNRGINSDSKSKLETLDEHEEFENIESSLFLPALTAKDISQYFNDSSSFQSSIQEMELPLSVSKQKLFPQPVLEKESNLLNHCINKKDPSKIPQREVPISVAECEYDLPTLNELECLKSLNLETSVKAINELIQITKIVEETLVKGKQVNEIDTQEGLPFSPVALSTPGHGEEFLSSPMAAQYSGKEFPLSAMVASCNGDEKGLQLSTMAAQYSGTKKGSLLSPMDTPYSGDKNQLSSMATQYSGAEERLLLSPIDAKYSGIEKAAEKLLSPMTTPYYVIEKELPLSTMTARFSGVEKGSPLSPMATPYTGDEKGLQRSPLSAPYPGDIKGLPISRKGVSSPANEERLTLKTMDSLTPGQEVGWTPSPIEASPNCMGDLSSPSLKMSGLETKMNSSSLCCFSFGSPTILSPKCKVDLPMSSPSISGLETNVDSTSLSPNTIVGELLSSPKAIDDVINNCDIKVSSEADESLIFTKCVPVAKEEMLDTFVVYGSNAHLEVIDAQVETIPIQPDILEYFGLAVRGIEYPSDALLEAMREDFEFFGDLASFAWRKNGKVYDLIVKYDEFEAAKVAFIGLQDKYKDLCPFPPKDIGPDQHGRFTLTFQDKKNKRYVGTKREFFKYGDKIPLITKGEGKCLIRVSYSDRAGALDALKQNLSNSEFPELQIAPESEVVLNSEFSKLQIASESGVLLAALFDNSSWISSDQNSQNTSAISSAMNESDNRERKKIQPLPKYQTELNLCEQNVFDSHCHIDRLFAKTQFKGKWSDFKSSKVDVYNENWEGCITVLCNPYKWDQDSWYQLLYEPDVWATVGCHPRHAASFTEVREMMMREMLRGNDKIRAVGEIGLDAGHENQSKQEDQESVFRKCLAIAIEMEKPLCLHIKGRMEEARKIMREMRVSKYHKIHLHCWRKDSWKLCQELLEEYPNMKVGLTPFITLISAISVRNVAIHLPLDRMLLETDSPYFRPRLADKSLGRYTHPGMVLHTASQVASLKGIPVSDVLAANRENVRAVYGI